MNTTSRRAIIYTVLLLTISLWSCTTKDDNLLIYAGSISQPVTEELSAEFESKTGMKTQVIFGGSGYVLSQMILSKKGDIYFPGSSDFMEIAKKKELILPQTEKITAYLVSSINVPKGNPKNIHQLYDLLQDNLKIAIANPENVCVGTYAVEIIEQNFNEKEKNKFKQNLINYTGSCSKTAAAIPLKTVDAIIGWHVFEHWNPEKIESIPLKREEITRIGYMPIAITTLSKQKEKAQKFIDFVVSQKGKAIFEKHGYFSSPEQSFEYIGTGKPIGGTYKLPEEWVID